MTIPELRSVYRNIRDTFSTGAYLPKQQFDTMIKSLVPDNATPEDYVETALQLTVPCTRCLQTGLYVAGTLNGKPITPGGICYRCQGKGLQTYHDAKRNTVYDITQALKGQSQ